MSVPLVLAAVVLAWTGVCLLAGAVWEGWRAERADLQARDAWFRARGHR